MSWIYLIIAGLFEIGFTTCLSLSENFKKPVWTAGFLVSVTLSMWLLNKATQTLPMGTAYAVWTGIGAVGTVAVGMIFFNEPTNFLRLFFLSTLILSIVGLKFFAGGH
ncbi:QacE family quaternary ammonium compound efflux SMR transporter [Pedobacter yulinensis]|uniref:Guanidinium exporter n=1 Tax=Pedobacter yulinensis TaxID=2126353 RepID=A0A2T3HRP2_9SPHI|nr:multidrug efflux SMR transporter [Pedobacter yulinensis]PST85135.1 QacE family quaternary ammonium compound efflux SMR transporter [Pedobacter yulinensis]